LALRISKVLAGCLKPSLQLCHLPVPGCQVVCCPSQLSLQIIPLLDRLDLELCLLLGDALVLGAKVGKICLGGGLLPTRLLETLLGLSEFCPPRRQILSGSAHRLAGRCFLTASLFQSAVQIVQFLGVGLDGPFAGCNLLPRRSEALLGLRQLVLEFRQALRERRNAAAQLSSALLSGLEALLSSRGLGLNLGSGLCELRQLLLLGVEIL
jgi:hypothetical protein